MKSFPTILSTMDQTVELETSKGTTELQVKSDTLIPHHEIKSNQGKISICEFLADLIIDSYLIFFSLVFYVFVVNPNSNIPQEMSSDLVSVSNIILLLTIDRLLHHLTQYFGIYSRKPTWIYRSDRLTFLSHLISFKVVSLI
ncbi:hypothetical protein DFJ63DRAFT_311686 [Scheffersomyces coipomensis]|uniref:uncharacterized protein n=1 Tax=Scheffersomyces coipomensis TaxID=1788519 RepID=UPI00315C9C9B